MSLMVTGLRSRWTFAFLTGAGIAITGAVLVQTARASSGTDCYGYLHEIEVGGSWRFFSLDCAGNCNGAGDCALVPVPGSGGLKWQCGCDGDLNGSCDATQVNWAGGVKGNCQGSCNPGRCATSTTIEWTDPYGVPHRLVSCACQ